MKYAKAFIFAFISLIVSFLPLHAATTDDLDYLCFTAEEAGSTIMLTQTGTPNDVSLEYSTDKKSWKTYTIGNTITLPKVGDKVYFRATSTNPSFGGSKQVNKNYNYFRMSGKIAGSGNIMSLLDKTCKQTTLPEYAFCDLFYECTKEEDHTDIFLPYDATELTPEQAASNPIHLAYPTAMQDKMPPIQCRETKSIGVFSVSKTTKVAFSPGNLQYRASTDTWRFAEHQYDCVGDANKGNVYANGTKCDNAQISSSYSGWIDLFGWGTSGYNNKYPYMTSTTGTDYGDKDKNISGTDYDWGVYNQIGTDPEGTWRTLTKSEWVYLCNTRPNADNLKGQATVNGVTGFIILPDDWVLPSGLSFVAGAHLEFTANNYTEQQWTQMEAAGACFMPAAGSRVETSVRNVQNHGAYWSSTYVDSDKVYNIYFGSSGYGPQNYDSRYYGRSVRLVHTL